MSSRLSQVKEEASGGEIEIAQFIIAQENMKDLFEEHVPIEMYWDMKVALERMGMVKAGMKVVNVDKFLSFTVKSYMKYFINYHSPADILWNAWTLYEHNDITLNELWISVELLNPT